MRDAPPIHERRRRHFPVGGPPRLDERTCAAGRAGIARSREILAEHTRWPPRSPGRRLRRAKSESPPPSGPPAHP